MIAILGLLLGVAVGIWLSPTLPPGLQPYLPIMIVAAMDAQELDSRRSTGAIYWEGAVRLREDGREVGRGYLEMTGYGERIRVG